MHRRYAHPSRHGGPCEHIDGEFVEDEAKVSKAAISDHSSTLATVFYLFCHSPLRYKSKSGELKEMYRMAKKMDGVSGSLVPSRKNFVGRGTGPGVPRFLQYVEHLCLRNPSLMKQFPLFLLHSSVVCRWSGTLQNTPLRKSELEHFIHDCWKQKSHYDQG